MTAGRNPASLAAANRAAAARARQLGDVELAEAHTDVAVELEALDRFGPPTRRAASPDQVEAALRLTPPPPTTGDTPMPTATATPLERAQQLAETAAGPLKTLEKATAARQRAEAHLAKVDTAWREAIKAAADGGVPVQDVAAAAGGIHRSRVWQIVTGRARRPAGAAR